jgi:hypothetical protein
LENTRDASSALTSMSENHWGPDRPPPDAYSRVTNPERFAPLHDFAKTLLATLEKTFEVERAEGYDLDPQVPVALRDRIQPAVRLRPRSASAASLLVSFTNFPGLVVRAGRWHREPVPMCGCDACDETAEGVIQRLSWLVENVTAGRFRETAVVRPGRGDAWSTTEIGWSDAGSATTQETRRIALTRAEADAMLADGRWQYAWEPWRRRPEAP